MQFWIKMKLPREKDEVESGTNDGKEKKGFTAFAHLNGSGALGL